MSKRKATIVVDLAFGDSGKGTIVDFLCRQRKISAVVRFNGGAQAAHNVVSPDGRHHTFSQFGSGTFVPGVETHLSRFMVIDPVGMLNEAFHLLEAGCGNVFERLTVDESALVTTPFQKAANRLRETIRGGARHGSCGLGVGETVSDNISFPDLSVKSADLSDSRRLAKKFKRIQELKRAEFKERFPEFAGNSAAENEIRILSDPQAPEKEAGRYSDAASLIKIVSGNHLKTIKGDIVFEGAQGVLLDEWYGFHPYTTWSTATFLNAQKLLSEIGYGGEIEKLGVLRAYFTRHGAGPFPTEDKDLSQDIPDDHNCCGQWQGNFRIGWFDSVLARYAIRVCGGVDTLAVTNLDRLPKKSRKICETYYFGSYYHLQVSELPVKKEPTNLVFQSRLSQLIQRCRPSYQEASSDDKKYLEQLGCKIGFPIKIISRGPTFFDKDVL